MRKQKNRSNKSNQKQKRLQVPNLWKDCHELLLLESLQVAWKSWIYPTSNACSSKGHSFSTHMIAKQLCSQSSSLKNKSLLHKKISTSMPETHLSDPFMAACCWPWREPLLWGDRFPVSGCYAWLAFILLSIYPELSKTTKSRMVSN